MTLRSKIFLYFIALHLIVGTAMVFVLLENRVLLFAVEALFILSVIVSYRLVRALFVPLDLIRTGAELINERDFTSRFVEVGQPEMDALITIYNEMIARLRDERLAAEEERQLLERMNPAARRLITPELFAEMRTFGPGESRLVAHGLPRRLKVWRAEFRDRGFAKTFFILDEMTEELRLSEKAAYEKLIRMMSHEVNNSVGAVRSLLESALRYAPQIGETDRDDYVSALTVASSRIDALNRFMSGFADVVRIPPPHRLSAPIAEIVERVAALLRPELESRAITLSVDADHSRADVDQHQIEQVVINVLRNAIDSIGERGAIEVTLRDRRLTIADSGGGIAPEAAADLFAPFFTTKREGRGLGLTIVQEILANHGFGYALRNREGGGAEFTIAM